MGASETLVDPYANPEVPNPNLDTSKLGPAFGSGWNSGQVAPEQQALSPDFLFPENFDSDYRRSWGDRLTYHIGVGYLAGLTAGGGFGLFDGLRSSHGERRRIRINAVLNSTGRRGPAWGNSAGCLAMMFSTFESLAFTVRGADDLLNVAGAGVLTGGIFKSGAGPKVAGGFALGFGALMTLGTFLHEQFGVR
eukprot:CAMPEP_0119307478 /NCGR_PEP_ID=MMETSP1333-20130426/7960_1 /TAXON_ID=418940 /ORGANISM="Scyphosphaera apsteinii, Strain RCC1455" /LENGTH=192 /DNA_ID=CAMNT_0007311031 /DNA_START=89 /DNA_END=667 /DNA_ORIENTATION=+